MSNDSSQPPAASQAEVFSGMVAAVLDAVGRQEQQVAEHVHRELHPSTTTPTAPAGGTADTTPAT